LLDNVVPVDEIVVPFPAEEEEEGFPESKSTTITITTTTTTTVPRPRDTNKTCRISRKENNLTFVLVSMIVENY
jgi:hypothetical protein